MGRYLSDSGSGCWEAGWWLVGAFEPGFYAQHTSQGVEPEKEDLFFHAF